MIRIRTREFYRENEDCVIVTYTQTPYVPAQTSGPAEICYQVEGGEVEQGRAKLVRGRLRDAAAIGQVALHHVGDERHLVLTGVLQGLPGYLLIEHAVLHQPACQAAQGYRGIGVHCASFVSIAAIAGPENETRSLESSIATEFWWWCHISWLSRWCRGRCAAIRE